MFRINTRRLVFSIAIACGVLVGIRPCTAANVPPNGIITNPAPEGSYVDYSDADQIKPLQIPAWGFDDSAFTHGSTVYHVASAGEFYNALSAASGSGGIIQIAAGSYTLDSKAVIPSNVIIQGAGVDQTTLVYGSGISADTAGMEAKYQSNIVLRDLTVDANNTSFIAISIRMCNNVLIERLVCRDGGRLGIRMPSTTKWTVRYIETYNHAQLHGLSASVETADADPGTEFPSYFSVYSSRMYNCGDHGLDLHAEYGEVAGCQIYGNSYGQSKQPDSVEVYLHNILYGDGSNYATRTYGTKRATSSMVYYYDIQYGGGYSRAAHIGGEVNGQAPGRSFWSYNSYGGGSKLRVSNGTVYVDPASSAEAGTSGTTTAPPSMIDAVNALRNTQGAMPTIDSFIANPSSIIAGQSATLSWTTTNATGVDINHGVGTGLPTEASTSVSPATTTMYTLTATGPGGTDTTTVTVEVNPPPTTDTDGDGILDYDETNLYGTDPDNADTDGDGMPDGWEISHGLDPVIDDAAEDLDNDGFANIQEFQSITNPAESNSIPQLPTADAGPDQTVNGGDTVVLDGSGSIDADDGIVSYLWEQIDGPSVTLSNPALAQPTFIVPDAGYGGQSLTFQLTVTDNGGLLSTDTCMVTVAAEPDTGSDDLTELTVSNLSVSSGRAYEVVQNGLHIKARAYIDRSYTYKSFPDSLENATYIKTANADKKLVGDHFLNFDVNRDVIVYIARDIRIAGTPSWLQNFTASGDHLTTTDATFRIFSRAFTAGRITLGGNKGGKNSSMYMVIIAIP